DGLALFVVNSHTTLTFFFFHNPAPSQIYTLSLHDALPIYSRSASARPPSTLALATSSKARSCRFPLMHHLVGRPRATHPARDTAATSPLIPECSALPPSLRFAILPGNAKPVPRGKSREFSGAKPAGPPDSPGPALDRTAKARFDRQPATASPARER